MRTDKGTEIIAAAKHFITVLSRYKTVHGLTQFLNIVLGKNGQSKTKRTEGYKNNKEASSRFNIAVFTSLEDHMKLEIEKI